MIKSSTYKVTSLLMAMMILMSSLGYNLDIHYCGGEFFDFSLLGNVKTCQSADEDDYKEKIVNRSCCDFEQIKIETSSSFEKSSSDFTSQFTLSFVPTIRYYSFYKGIRKETNKWVLDPPPEINSNPIYLEIQSFLI